MNFLQLCQRLRQETGISDSGPGTVTGQTGDMKRIIDWTNDAWLRLQTLRPDWFFMWTSDIWLPLTQECDKPSTVGEFLIIKYGDIELQRKHYRDLKQSTELSAYAILPNGRVRFDFDPNGLELHYEGFKRPVRFSEGIEAPSMPEPYHMIIVWSALMEYAMFDEAPELMQKARLNFEQMLAELSRNQLSTVEAPSALV